MNLLLTVVILGSIGCSLELTDEDIAKIKEIKQECIESSGADEDVVNKSREGIFKDDSKLKDFFLCFFKEPGFLNETGEYQTDVIKEKFTTKYGEAMADKLVSECASENHGGPSENAYHLAKCYYGYIRVKN